MVSCGDGEVDEIIAYNELSDMIDKQQQAHETGEFQYRAFKEILDHQHVTQGSPAYNGSSYNVQIHWEDGSTSWEPLAMVMKDDPVTLAAYAKEHDLLDTPGWKRLRRIAKRDKVLRRMLNQVRRIAKCRSVTYKFGVAVPRNVKEAIKFDKDNGDTLWQDAMALEIKQLHEYSAFIDKGYNAPTPPGYQRIRAHMIFDVKQDGRRKAPSQGSFCCWWPYDRST